MGCKSEAKKHGDEGHNEQEEGLFFADAKVDTDKLKDDQYHQRGDIGNADIFYFKPENHAVEVGACQF